MRGLIYLIDLTIIWITRFSRVVGRIIYKFGKTGLGIAKKVFQLPICVYVFCLAISRAVSFYQGSILLASSRVWGVVKREGLQGVIRRASILTHTVNRGHYQRSIDLYGKVSPLAHGFMPKVSIIVPNFNHANYLVDRLESIYNQTYSNYEVILLDDCSTDESVEILQDYANRYPHITIGRFNEINSGGVFNQWKKGIELATGELVWIAESDDYCSANLLEELVRCFQNEAVKLAFAYTEFVCGTPPTKIWTLEEYLSDIGFDEWKSSFIKSAHEMVRSGWVVKNLVPNASCAVFRHPGELNLFNDPQWLGLRICGDWVFYLSIIRGGLVAYSPHATNYYRQHSFNISSSTQKEDAYYREHEIVAVYLAKLYHFERSDFKLQEIRLYQHWCSSRGAYRYKEFKSLYDIDRAWLQATERKPNIAICVYALSAGGGETFPVMLANLLHSRGYAVSLFNCNKETIEMGIRRMLLPSVPLFHLDRIDFAANIFSDMGIEIAHSHHAWVDVSLATLLLHHREIRHIVTVHGMYEMMTSEQLHVLLPLLKRQIDCFVYTAKKNLTPFPTAFLQEIKFYEIKNALSCADVKPVAREELGVASDDFVLCLVSRAIAEKGWEEAIMSVALANVTSDRKIHLLLIGEGPEYTKLKSQYDYDFIHFLGFRSNIRDYFASSDMGFLPSRFKGESSPLVLIDCLYSGKPMLASNIGEVCSMLESGEGLAGVVFDLEDWTIPIEILGTVICKIANSPILYESLLHNVPLALEKFDVNTMVDKYEAVYNNCLHKA